MNVLRKLLAALKQVQMSKGNSDYSREEIVLLIERFLDDKCSDNYEWRDFLDYASADPIIEKARNDILSILYTHIEAGGKGFCDEKGKVRIREIASNIRTET